MQWLGSGRSSREVGQGRARSGKVGQGRARSGKVGQGRARSGKVGQGRARSGRRLSRTPTSLRWDTAISDINNQLSSRRVIDADRAGGLLITRFAISVPVL